MNRFGFVGILIILVSLVMNSYLRCVNRFGEDIWKSTNNVKLALILRIAKVQLFSFGLLSEF